MHLIDEISAQLDNDPDGIPHLDITVRMLCNRSVGWIVEAIWDISNKDFVKKVHLTVLFFTPYLLTCWAGI